MDNLTTLLTENTTFITSTSILIALSGSMVFYFGKIISSMKIEQRDKWEIYIEGLLFVLFYIVVPLSISYLVFKKWINPFISILPATSLILLFLISLYCVRLMLIEARKSLSRTKFYVDPWTKFKLFLIAFIPAFATIIEMSEKEDPVIQTLFVVSLFFILTIEAMVYGYSSAYYPYIKISLATKKRVIKGKILKYGDFIKVQTDGGTTILINRDAVNYIEELDKNVKK